MTVLAFWGYEASEEVVADPDPGNSLPAPFWSHATGFQGSTTTNVQSGKFGGTLINRTTLGTAPPWSDTSENFWWCHFMLQFRAATHSSTGTTIFASGSETGVAGPPFYIIRVTHDTTKLLTIKVYRHTSVASGTGGTQLGTYTFGASEDTEPNWIAIRIGKSNGATHATVEVWVNDTQRITYTETGDAGTSSTNDATHMNVASAIWVASQWVGNIVTCGGSTGLVTANTTTQLTVDSWVGGTPADGSTFTMAIGAKATHAFGHIGPVDGKGAPRDNTFYVDDYILLDEGGSSYNGRIAAGAVEIWGYQPDADVTGYNDWAVSNLAKKYRNCDDYNDTNNASEPVDDYVKSSTDDAKQLFRLADEPNASANIGAVIVSLYHRVSTSAAFVNFLVGCSDEGTGPVEYSSYWSMPNNYEPYPSLFLPLTPGGNAWTLAKLNAFYAGIQKNEVAATERQVRIVGVQVLGDTMTGPTANADANNDDVADPWAVVSAFVARVMVY